MSLIFQSQQYFATIYRFRSNSQKSELSAKVNIYPYLRTSGSFSSKFTWRKISKNNEIST